MVIGAVADNTSRFVDQSYWDACVGDSQLIEGEQVVVAWDASSTQDLTCVIAMSMDKPHRTQCHFIVPQGAVRKNENIPYKAWEVQGYCEIEPTPYISKQRILDIYKNLQERYVVVASQSDNFALP